MKRDANDVLREHGAEGLRDAFDKAPRVTTEAEGEAPAPVRATPWRWVEPAAIPRRQWLHGRHLIRKFVSATIAPGGAGKSSLVIAECLEMVTGRPLLTGRAGRALRVWYWNGEDPAEEIDRRVAAAAIAFQLLPGDVAGRMFVDSGRDRPMTIAAYNGHRSVVVNSTLVAGLVAEVRRRKIDVLIIDPLKRAHAVDENDNTAMDLVLQQFARIADEGDCGLALVHHTRKLGVAEVTAESSRGAKSVVDASRSVRVLNTMSKDEAERAGVGDDHRRYFRVFPDKLNLAPPAEASDWYRLESITLGNGPDGTAGDSVGVAMPWTWPDAFTGITAATVLAVQRRIDGERWREAPQAENWIGKAVAEVIGVDIAGKPERARVRQLVRAWIKSGALLVVEHPDPQRRMRAYVEVGEWAT